MGASSNTKTGLDALLTPSNCAVILIDHQPFQVSGVQNTDPALMINNVVMLAKSAKVFGVPTLLTTVVEERGGYLIKPLQDVFPEQKPLNRTTINTWEDTRVVDWVKKTGRKKLVMAALWTEICLAFPVIHALGEGYEVYIVTDASGGVSAEAHTMAIHRMVQAGAVPLTSAVFLSELQRDWAREETAGQVSQIVLEHMGAVGTNLAWELQLLRSNGIKLPPGV
ncbi:hydrolase [Stigmatella sp. ncwal1]|uniref:Hydrolase n=1 Tax=Stigmatella ashevillensis TaxID=2995309 RepID=A0ABT5D8I3_9BACT|nr:hydrolase [Stigmatella ashevillena]MDC0709359.1 hydrolase [Stigmatella ashevillena]